MNTTKKSTKTKRKQNRGGRGVAVESGVVAKGAGGKFVATGGLSPKQALFVRFFSNGMKQTDAARAAGYVVPNCAAWDLLQLPHVRQAIWETRDKLIRTDLASLGVKVLRELMENKKTPAHVRFQAARFSVEAAGHVQKASTALPGSSKPLSEMSIAELAEFIKAGKEAMDSLKVVDGDVIEASQSCEKPALRAE